MHFICQNPWGAPLEVEILSSSSSRRQSASESASNAVEERMVTDQWRQQHLSMPLMPIAHLQQLWPTSKSVTILNISFRTHSTVIITQFQSFKEFQNNLSLKVQYYLVVILNTVYRICIWDSGFYTCCMISGWASQLADPTTSLEKKCSWACLLDECIALFFNRR